MIVDSTGYRLMFLHDDVDAVSWQAARARLRERLDHAVPTARNPQFVANLTSGEDWLARMTIIALEGKALEPYLEEVWLLMETDKELQWGSLKFTAALALRARISASEDHAARFREFLESDRIADCLTVCYMLEVPPEIGPQGAMWTFPGAPEWVIERLAFGPLDASYRLVRVALKQSVPASEVAAALCDRMEREPEHFAQLVEAVEYCEESFLSEWLQVFRWPRGKEAMSAETQEDIALDLVQLCDKFPSLSAEVERLVAEIDFDPSLDDSSWSREITPAENPEEVDSGRKP